MVLTDLTLSCRRTRKASGPSRVVAKILKSSDESGITGMLNICNAVVKEVIMPDDWKKSLMVNVFKGKGDALEWSSYRGIKLLEPMKTDENR